MRLTGNTEDIYFFEVNTKYISSNVMKISVNFLIFSSHEMKYFRYIPKKKGKFSFYFFSLGELDLTENKPHQN